MQIVKEHWWKIAAALLVLYSLVFGIMWPLKPGIKATFPTNSVMDTTLMVTVTGYNTHYKSAETNRAWLKLDGEFAVLANEIKVVNENELTLVFQIPPYLPFSENTAVASLVIDNEVDGPSVKPSALFMKQEEPNPEMGFAYWKRDEIENLSASPYPRFPFRGILEETIRNTYFHVPMWFGMIFLFLFSMYYSTQFLRGRDYQGADKAYALNKAGLVYGILGLLTGMIWAKFTWNAFWSMDVKQNMSAIATLIYFAYFLLYKAIPDTDKRNKLVSAYNIFAFLTLIPLLFIIPRMQDSLHPGNGGNPAFGGEDLDNTMRLIFYPAVIGWTLLGFWIASLSFRIEMARRTLSILLKKQ